VFPFDASGPFFLFPWLKTAGCVIGDEFFTDLFYLTVTVECFEMIAIYLRGNLLGLTKICGCFGVSCGGQAKTYPE